MMNKNGESRHPCHILSLKKRFQLFNIECDVSSDFVIYGFYYVMFLYPQCVKNFYYKWRWGFLKCFFFIYCYNQIFYSLFCLCGVLYIWFRNIEPTLQPGNKSQWIMVCNLFNALLSLFWYYFVEDFYICLSRILVYNFLYLVSLFKLSVSLESILEDYMFLVLY